MAVFSTNGIASVYRSQGLSMFGQPGALMCILSNVKVAVIGLHDIDQMTPSKMESSGSHGRADVDKGNANVQFPPGTRLNLDDVVVIDEAAYRVSACDIMRDLFSIEQFIDVTMRRMEAMPPIIASPAVPPRQSQGSIS